MLASVKFQYQKITWSKTVWSYFYRKTYLMFTKETFYIQNFVNNWLLAAEILLLCEINVVYKIYVCKWGKLR